MELAVKYDRKTGKLKVIDTKHKQIYEVKIKNEFEIGEIVKEIVNDNL